MPVDVRIREAKEADVPAIAAIYAPAVLHGTATFELEPPGEAEMLRRFRDITGAGYPFLVAELGGDVAGYGYASAYRARPAYRFTVEDSIYLHDAARGRGIGKALLAAVVEESAARGFRRMIAIIGDSANVASVAVHRSVGFTHTGTMHAVGYKFGRWLDTVIMERPLGEGDGPLP